MFDLSGKIAVVSGASSGLGKQMAEAFARQGANLAILARRFERLETFAAELKEKYDFITDARGSGLLVGLELNFEGADIVGKMLEEGFLINCTAGNVLRFAPPLVVKEEEIDALVEALDKVFASL